MPRRTTRKPTVTQGGTEARHKYVPHDHVADESWKATFKLTDPEVSVTLDRGTFEWLWDFVSRKGRQADASNFHYSDIHKDVYQKAANQFSVAASEAFGDTYLVTEPSKTKKVTTETPSEALVEPSKARRRRKPKGEGPQTFSAPTEASDTTVKRRRRKSRSTTQV